MFKIKHFIFLIIALFVIKISEAQQLNHLNLFDAISEGLENNFSILLARNSAEVSSNNATRGNAGMLPSVNLNGTLSMGHSTTHIAYYDPARPSIDRDATTRNMNANVAFDWTVFDGLAMFANYERLKELELIGHENLRAAVQQTIAAIMNVYFDIVSRQQELDATERILQISRLRMESANDRFLSGRFSKVEVLSAQVDFNADTASYIRQVEDLRKSKIQLNRLLSKEITFDFWASDSIFVDQTLQYGNIFDAAMAENPNLIISRMSTNVAALTLKATEGAQYPRLRLTSNYILANTDNGTDISANQSRTFNYGLTLSMPLFNGFNVQRQIANARLEKESAEIRYQQMQKDIESQVATAYSTYVAYRNLSNFEAANLDLAAENLDISMERYRLGAISAVELRDVQRSFIAATNRHIVATYNAKISETALKLLVGNVMLL
jgi:outer membrane protein TolC